MNNPTASQLSQDSFQHFDQAAPYTGDYLITVDNESCVTIFQELDELTLNMSIE